MRNHVNVRPITKCCLSCYLRLRYMHVVKVISSEISICLKKKDFICLPEYLIDSHYKMNKLNTSRYCIFFARCPSCYQFCPSCYYICGNRSDSNSSDIRSYKHGFTLD